MLDELEEAVFSKQDALKKQEELLKDERRTIKDEHRTLKSEAQNAKRELHRARAELSTYKKTTKAELQKLREENEDLQYDKLCLQVEMPESSPLPRQVEASALVPAVDQDGAEQADATTRYLDVVRRMDAVRSQLQTELRTANKKLLDTETRLASALQRSEQATAKETELRELAIANEQLNDVKARLRAAEAAALVSQERMAQMSKMKDDSDAATRLAEGTANELRALLASHTCDTLPVRPPLETAQEGPHVTLTHPGSSVCCESCAAAEREKSDLQSQIRDARAQLATQEETITVLRVENADLQAIIRDTRSMLSQATTDLEAEKRTHAATSALLATVMDSGRNR
ncbi:hypothetical protein CALVIDRAFT_568438 [Calocera viscosa TUFC12733]|uniref:Uncharacterized protein n=1 Tax=Calocera viscosa (strain TUFC12733) TaxID=1330018 RepID=A0A167H2N9_CALVF|nr:hypothetical protein CALVIDRAFT_568438 [Calocera viscosa TUFC12733]